MNEMLARVEDSTSKAYCKLCEKMLSAEISSLKRHCLSKYHVDKCRRVGEKSTGSNDPHPTHNNQSKQCYWSGL